LDPTPAYGRPTLAQCLENSLQQLGEPARALLRLLSVFQAPFTTKAVQRLAQAASLETGHSWPALLEELRGLGLLLIAPLPPNGQLAVAEEPMRLLHLVRDQGRCEARALGLWQAYLNAHIDVLIDALEAMRG
jgi:hypothetical protein